MLSRLREHLGSAGLIVAIVALVAALGGGAYAANGGSGDGNATTSATGKQGKQGKPGKTGPAGPAGLAGAAGAQGPAGPAGPQGPAGAKGDTGAAGSAGAAGKSAETVSFPGSKGSCDGVVNGVGGVEVKSASSPVLVCNGKPGTNGTTGFTETLPSGKTETGVWSGAFSGVQYIPLSFNIPLAAPINGAANVIIVAEGGSDPSCDNGTGAPGSSANPEAAPGFFCLFIGALENTSVLTATLLNPETFSGGVGRTGVIFNVEAEAAKVGFGLGTWAVTAP
jgi:hypothetical protein